MALLIACLWPLIAFAYVIYTGNRYIAEHPGEVNDAPAMVLMGLISISPFIFLGELITGAGRPLFGASQIFKSRFPMIHRRRTSVWSGLDGERPLFEVAWASA
jgi:hypothetical protein